MIHLDVSAAPNVELVAKKEGYVEQFPAKFGSCWILFTPDFSPKYFDPTSSTDFVKEKRLPQKIHPGRLTWKIQITHLYRKEHDLPNLYDYVPC